MWIPREPDVFGQPTSPTASSASLQTSATSRICAHGTPGHRVQVHPQLVGMVQVVGADRVRVEVDAAEVGDPGEPGRVVDDDLVRGPAGREGQRRRRGCHSGGSPGPASGRTAALAAPSTNRLSAIGRPPDAAQRAVGDGQVVADEVAASCARSPGSRPCCGLVTVDLAAADRRGSPSPWPCATRYPLDSRRTPVMPDSIGRGLSIRAVGPFVVADDGAGHGRVDHAGGHDAVRPV